MILRILDKLYYYRVFTYIFVGVVVALVASFVGLAQDRAFEGYVLAIVAACQFVFAWFTYKYDVDCWGKLR